MIDRPAGSAYLSPTEYMTDDEVRTELERLRPSQPGAATSGSAALLRAYGKLPADVHEAARDALLAQLGRPPANMHPASELLRDASFVDIAAALLAVRDGSARLPQDRAAAVRASLLSSSALPELLETTANTVATEILDADAGRIGWLAPLRAKDFKESSALRIVGGAFTEPGESGRIAAAPFEVSAEPTRVVHRVSDWRLSIEALLSMSAAEPVRLMTLAAASAASRLIRRTAFELLEANPVMSDSTELFHATRGNVVTGGSLNAATLGSAMDKLASMTTADDSALDAQGAYMLCSASNYPAAATLVEAMGGGLVVIGSPHIATALFYLVPSPALVPTISLVTLADAPFSIGFVGVDSNADSLRYRCRADFGISATAPYLVRVTA